MDVKEFSKYVLDNINRATLSNAMNIANKIDKPEFYSFNDFIIGLENYTVDLLKLNKKSPNICYNILSCVDKHRKRYNSDIKYNKLFIIDDLLIDLWRIVNET